MLTIFDDFSTRHSKKNVQSHVFEICGKNVKYVFSKTADNVNVRRCTLYRPKHSAGRFVRNERRSRKPASGEGRGSVGDVTAAAAAHALRNRKHNAAGDGRRRRSAHARVARLHPARHGGGGGGVPQAVLLQRAQSHRVLLAARSDRHPGRDARRHAPAEPQRQRVPLVDDRPPKLLGERRAPAPLHERLRTRNAPGRHVPRSRRPALARSQQQPTAGIRTLCCLLVSGMRLLWSPSVKN